LFIFIDFLSHFIDIFTIFIGNQNPGPGNDNKLDLPTALHEYDFEDIIFVMGTIH